ncbi:hypothetical protein AB0D04_08070 [Streptomyces sp. NPDC048483]|uniref:hypothetical protein n=1 Tax=Streptomyces sp. NPDC048483 TaxID=3154927 RepID=UPI00341D26C8
MAFGMVGDIGVRSLFADLKRPAVNAFLTAVDTTMNSNTLLLKASADTPVTHANHREVLNSFLRDPLFHAMMLEADQERDWWMFHEAPWQTPDPSLTNSMDAGPWLVREDVPLTLNPLDEAGLLARLRWMLCEAFSPYRTHLQEEHAQEIIRAFLWEVCSAHSGSAAMQAGHKQWLSQGWSFAAVQPDFLPSSEYYTEEPCPELSYFDGGKSDTATFFYRGDVFLLLLTNGSP